MKICALPDCNRVFYCNQWCRPHYRRWLKYGDPEGQTSTVSHKDTMKFLTDAAQSDAADCIIWPFSRSAPNGYGVITIDGKRRFVHRMICEIKYGLPPEPMDAAHGPCHNRSCINPNHLSWKTRRDNILDRHRDGTMLFGETSPKSKYTDQEILELRILYKNKSVSQAQFSRDHNIARRTLRQIMNGETWKHLL